MQTNQNELNEIVRNTESMSLVSPPWFQRMLPVMCVYVCVYVLVNFLYQLDWAMYPDTFFLNVLEKAFFFSLGIKI